jgi:ATP-binding protein involved in chromosome partitioning
MSIYICPCCQYQTHIFGKDGVNKIAKDLKIDFLGDIPLDAEICDLADIGNPIVIAKPDSIHAKSYKDIALKIITKLGIT